MLDPSPIQPLDALRRQQKAVGDDGGDYTVGTDRPNDLVQVRMEQRFPSADVDDLCSQPGQQVDATKHLLCRHGRGHLVILVAISAGEIAPSHRDDVSKYWMVSRLDGTSDHARLTQPALVKPECLLRRSSSHIP